LKTSGIMSKIHAVSIKTDTVDEFRTNYKDKAEEVLCRGGSKYEKKLAQKQDEASQGKKTQ
jgi:hypothetical protein